VLLAKSIGRTFHQRVVSTGLQKREQAKALARDERHHMMGMAVKMVVSARASE
jgi:hypothetical protein